MSPCRAVARPLIRKFQQQCTLRHFTAGAVRAAQVDEQQQQQQQQPPPPATQTEPTSEPAAADLDPNTVMPEFEAQLIKAGIMPIGSRRRRVAMRTTDSIPFEQLPYQAFQEARKILAADREDKLAKIRSELDKIARLERKDPADIKGGQPIKDIRLAGLRKEVTRLKILADVNDPLVKKRFEDGLGDMNKPIYRYYAEKKWRSYDNRLITQRIKQFNIVPDVLPKLETTADVQLYFRQLKIPPGQIVDSAISENPPRLRVQVFDKGERLVTVVVIDADVPDVANDGFTKRCHFLAANVPLSPVVTSIPLSRIKADDQLAVPWLPAFSQKGAPYHRLGIYLLEQKPGEKLDVALMRRLYSKRDGVSLKSLRDKFGLTPFGFNMFRSVWDENTAAVMTRQHAPGANVELRRTRIYSLKPPVKARGWEAKRQGPKYRHLWKYTKRIRGLSNARGWTKRR
ncbi:phosphatidylethanolamine-binding protein [Hirsutella rhossiliensis]|uniref:Large ribosomal subunit protein mL38 n=1 Tax=Hirsutella rhossiliensis TaxID=111463 RepID=A0A9P8MIP5_9HYPO|nr:phosphatidylethanolamine-binding protein [Hirsutella rhossiliensis]KAH0957088.1 phosphatidylethanolamine-binding protein [Hirsutella rhossiliensis]